MITVVDLKRVLHYGNRGYDVKAVKRGLHAAGHKRPSLENNRFGSGTYTAVKNFQKQHGLKADGVYGERTHNKLKPYMSKDGYAAWLYNHAKVPPPTPVLTVREQMVRAGFLTFAHRDDIHYTMGAQRMEGVRNKIHPPNYPHWEDCSSMYTWWSYVSGAPDPNGFNYAGYGFTGTMVLHGTRLASSSQLRRGDAVFYGRNNSGDPTHVAMYAGTKDGVMMVISHGSEAGPLYLALRYRHDIHSYRTYM